MVFLHPRYGARVGTSVAAVAWVLWSAVSTAAEISVRQLQQSSFELTLTNDTVLDETVARTYLSQAAASVCRELAPILGKYRFDSKEALGASVLSRERPSYRFVQEISCVPRTQTASPVRQPTITSPAEMQQVREEVKGLSEAYFRLLAAKRFDEAYAQLNETALGTDKVTWTRERQAFQSVAGAPVAISIIKITVYDNPAEAPEPGLYVAADFQNSYKNAPYECGYLMWFREAGSPYVITRSEMGHVTSETLKTIPESQRPELFQKLRCVAP
jgi:hypothetical protein